MRPPGAGAWKPPCGPAAAALPLRATALRAAACATMGHSRGERSLQTSPPEALSLGSWCLPGPPAGRDSYIIPGFHPLLVVFVLYSCEMVLPHSCWVQLGPILPPGDKHRLQRVCRAACWCAFTCCWAMLQYPSAQLVGTRTIITQTQKQRHSYLKRATPSSPSGNAGDRDRPLLPEVPQTCGWPSLCCTWRGGLAR